MQTKLVLASTETIAFSIRYIPLLYNDAEFQKQLEKYHDCNKEIQLKGIISAHGQSTICLRGWN